MSRFSLVSVIIPTRGEAILAHTLEALQQVEPVVPMEIVVAGQDPDRLIAESDRLHFIEGDRPLIPAEARNLGVKHAKGDLFVFLDSDAIVESDWLKRLIEAVGAKRDVVHGAMEFCER